MHQFMGLTLCECGYSKQTSLIDDVPVNIRDLSPQQHVSEALLDHSSLDCRVSMIANRTIDTLATCAANDSTKQHYS